MTNKLTHKAVANYLQQLITRDQHASRAENLSKLLKPETLSRFFHMCITHLVISNSEHNSVYDGLHSAINGIAGPNITQYRRDVSFIQPLVPVFFVQRKIIKRKVPLLTLFVTVAHTICACEKAKIKGWRELPASIYRALECYMREDSWERFTAFERCDIGVLPKEIYFSFHPAIYCRSDVQHMRRNYCSTASLAVYTILVSKLQNNKLVKRAYSALHYYFETGDISSIGCDSFLLQLANDVRRRPQQSLFNTLCDTLPSVSDITLKEHCSKVIHCKLEHVEPVQPWHTPLITLPRQLRKFMELHDSSSGKVRVLQLNCSELDLHFTVQQLRKTYAIVNLLSDYVIYSSGNSHSYLALSKRDHKLITDVILPHMRINRYFTCKTLPVFLHIANGLVNGDTRSVHISLMSVYDIVIGWASRQSYFKVLQEEVHLRASVTFLCQYAGCFNSPQHLFTRLIEPYNVETGINLDFKGRHVRSICCEHCPQNAIRSIIMLNHSHNISIEDFDILYDMVCVKHYGETHASYKAVYRWLKELHRSRLRIEKINYRRLYSSSACNSIVLRRKPLNFLYEYLLNEECLDRGSARYLCESLWVSQFSLHVPGQTPGLQVANELESDSTLSLSYQNFLLKHNVHRTRKPAVDTSATEKLCMLLKQLEYIKMHSTVQHDNNYRGKLRRVPLYIGGDCFNFVTELKTQLPLTIENKNNIVCTRELFPVFDCYFYKPELMSGVMHTASSDLFTCMFYNKLPLKQ